MTATMPSAQIEPFFFGPRARQLYGCYHEPLTWPARDCGVVICYPMGQEYIRSHRACHHLAAQLAQAGFPALRFDYMGTGDSADDFENATIDQWLADIALAVEELRNRSAVETVVLAGLRMGASLALKAALRRSAIAGLVLWEPVINGKSYIEELQAQQAEVVLRFFARPIDYVVTNPPAELLGFPISTALYAGIEQLDLLAEPTPRQRPVLIIENNPRQEITLLQERLQSTSARVAYQHVPSFVVWAEDIDKGLVPSSVLQAIVGWMSEVFE